MSQEKDAEMGGEGGAASQNKSQSSVVDDFLAALFASHPPPVEDNDPKPLPNDDPIQQGAGVKRERTPDEFDEYEMLSKRKHNAQKQEDSTITSTTATATAASSNVRHQTTAPSGREQDLAPEARMLIRNLPYAVRKRDVLAHFSKYGHIHDCYLKNTSGYIQFANPESCVAAVQAENGKMFRGGIIELEVQSTRPQTSYSDEYGAGENYQMQTDSRPSPGFRRDANQMSYPAVKSEGLASPSFRDTTDQRGYNTQHANGNYARGRGHVMASTRHEYKDGISKTGHRKDFNDKRSHSRGGSGGRGGPTEHYPYRHDDGYNENRRPRFDQQPYEFQPYSGNMNNATSNVGGEYEYYGENEGYRSYDGNRMRGRRPARGGGSVSAGRGKKMANMSHRGRGGKSVELGGSGPQQQWYQNVNGSAASTSFLLPRRYGQGVPTVQIVAWGNVNRGFIDYIESSFSSQRIQAHTLFLQYGQVTRDDLVKQLIMEGVKALLVVEPGSEVEGKISLQVFEPNTEAGAGSYKFEEYDRISIEEAVAVLNRSRPDRYSPTQQPQQKPVATAVPVSNPQYTTSTANVSQPLPVAPTTPATIPSINPNTLDPNTLSTLINIVKGMVQQPQQTPSPSAVQRPPMIPTQQQQPPPVQPTSYPQPQPQQTYPAPSPSSIPSQSTIQQLLAVLANTVKSTPTASSVSSASSSRTTSAMTNVGQVPVGSLSQQVPQYVPSSAAAVVQQQQRPPLIPNVSSQPMAGALTSTPPNFATAIPTSSSSTTSMPPPQLNNAQIGDILNKLQLLTQTPLPQRQ